MTHMNGKGLKILTLLLPGASLFLQTHLVFSQRQIRQAVCDVVCEADDKERHNTYRHGSQPTGIQGEGLVAGV